MENYKYTYGELESLREIWESYFSRERTRGKEALKLLYDQKDTITDKERKIAEDLNFNIRNDNIITPMAEKLAESLSKRKHNITIKKDLDKKLKDKGIDVTDILKNSRYELDLIIKDIVNEGYACALVDIKEKTLIRLASHYRPFFDKFAHSPNFQDGEYCGYMSTMSYASVLRKFPNSNTQAFKDAYHANKKDYISKIQSVEVRHIWVREGDKIEKYSFTDYFLFDSTDQTQYKALPMVFIGNIGYKDTEKIRLVRIADESKDLQAVHNLALSITEYQTRNSQNSYMTTIDSVPPDLAKDWTDDSVVVKKYIDNQPLSIKGTAPIVIKAPPVQPITYALIKDTATMITARWMTEMDATDSSKYDSLRVLSEKQRAAQNAGISTLRRELEQGLHAIIYVMISQVIGFEAWRVGMHSVKIGEDEQREDSIKIELYLSFAQYLAGIVPELAPVIMQEVLKTFGDSTADELEKLLTRTQKTLQQKQEQAVQNRPEEIKAQAELGKTSLTSQTQITITKMQVAAEMAKSRDNVRIAAMKADKETNKAETNENDGLLAE